MLTLGWAFIVLGIAGIFLPVLQGVLFLFIGLVILSTEYVWANRVLVKARTRFPHLAERIDHAVARVRAWRAPWRRRKPGFAD